MASRCGSGRRIGFVLLPALLLGGCGNTPTASAPAIAQTTPSPRPTATPRATPSVAPSPDATPTVAPTPSVDPTIADLTGVKTDPALAHRLPLAVLLDDNRVARPQSGFNNASIVYQAPADGGETRYMFVYQEGDSRTIGPVRSARIYFIHWATEVNAAIAHYGGDRQSRSYLRVFHGERLTNLDALAGSGKAFHRISSRKMPHNGYTSTAALRAMALKRGAQASTPVDMDRRAFVAPSELALRAASQRIRVPYRTGVIEYRFDRASNLYKRFVGGVLQVDPADGKVVTTRNVVVMFMSFKTDTRIEPGHSRPVVGSIGSGRAMVFREGRMVEATWSKRVQVGTTHLFDASGNEIPLVTGRTFFQIVAKGTKVTAGP